MIIIIGTRVKCYINYITTIRTVKNSFRLFVTQLQSNLVHTLKKKNKQQNIGHEIHQFNQRGKKRTSRER